MNVLFLLAYLEKKGDGLFWCLFLGMMSVRLESLMTPPLQKQTWSVLGIMILSPPHRKSLAKGLDGHYVLK